jgi:hypothetical protein
VVDLPKASETRRSHSQATDSDEPDSSPRSCGVGASVLAGVVERAPTCAFLCPIAPARPAKNHQIVTLNQQCVPDLTMARSWDARGSTRDTVIGTYEVPPSDAKASQ